MIVCFLTIILTFLAVAAIQIWWWIPKNGFSLFGTCVNHFGEPYSCNVFDWIARAFLSPFAWPAVLIIAIICFAISSIILKVIRHKKLKDHRSISETRGRF
jgi:hypothetical protein